MMAQRDVDTLIRQTRRYEFADGLRDLQLAVLFVVGSVTVWLSLEPFWFAFVVWLAATFGRWAAWLSLLPMVFAPLAVWGMLGVMDHVRRRWLWRESGMVKPTRWIVRTRINVLAAAVILGGIGAGVLLRYFNLVEDDFVLRMLWTATGWGFGLTLIGVGRHIGLPRYIWLGVAGAIASSGVLFLPLAFGHSALAFGLLWAAMPTVSGVITLRNSIRESHAGR